MNWRTKLSYNMKALQLRKEQLSDYEKSAGYSFQEFGCNCINTSLGLPSAQEGLISLFQKLEASDELIESIKKAFVFWAAWKESRYGTAYYEEDYYRQVNIVDDLYYGSSIPSKLKKLLDGRRR